MSKITPVGGPTVPAWRVNHGREQIHGATFTCPECGNEAKIKPRVLAPDVIEWPSPMCARHPQSLAMRRLVKRASEVSSRYAP